MYKQRIKIFLAIIAVVLLILIAKLFHLQVVRGPGFRDQFANERRTKFLAPIRGEICDRNGVVLARDRRQYDFCLDYRLMESLRQDEDAPDTRWVRQQKRAIQRNEGYSAAEAEAIYQHRVKRTMDVARELASRNGVDLDAEIDRIIRRVERLRQYVNPDPTRPMVRVMEEEESHPMVRGLDDQNVNLAETVGASIVPSLQRWYVRGGVACHILGYTGQVSRADQEKYNQDDADPLIRKQRNYLDGDIIGQAGIEKMCEKTLRGRRGYLMFDRAGKVVETVPAENGRDVRLTIDADLQEELTNEMARRGYKGSIVAVSIPDGEILAMVSTPTYDPNTFRRDYKLLDDNRLDNPMLNRAIAEHYPPGSTAKPIAAAAGLACGLSSGTSYMCSGSFYPDRPEQKGFHCDNRNGHGPLTLVPAMQHSCNVYFFHVGQYVGAERLAQWLRYFGYGVKPGTGLGEEKPGNVPDRAINRGDPSQWAIGQGEFDATPLQVASAMAAIAQGQYISPRIVMEGGPAQVRRAITLTSEQWAAIRKGMWEVVNTPEGTAYSAFREGAADRMGVVVCGKTGTADASRRIDSNGDGKLTSQDQLLKGNMAWFAGYAPYTDPQVAFAVVVEWQPEGTFGATAAAPIASKLIGLCKQRGYIGE